MTEPTRNTRSRIDAGTVKVTFPHAPLDWSPAAAEQLAKAEGLTLTDNHWEVIQGLQEYFARHGEETNVSVRNLHDALDEHFHARGGLKALYLLFPGGPIAQGCRLAGLKAPYLATDTSYGSVG
jgi:tRNA 2-thiouridine synthesizing protein E